MGRNRKTHEKFLEEMEKLVGDEYTVLDRYVKNNISISLKHNICGTIYSPKPIDFLRGSRCLECSGNKKKTTASFKEEALAVQGKDYEVIGEYIDNKTKITFRHNVCQKEYKTTPHNFLRQQRCPKCTFKYNKDTQYFKGEVFSLVENEYTVTGKYATTSTKITMVHNTCGSTFDATPHSFLKGTRCSVCSSSKGEELIRKTLLNLNIPFKTEFTFEECVDKKKLRFDFALFQDDKLAALIEFDGKQHFEPVSNWGGESTLAKVKARDAIKDKFCLREGIKLYRIPYWCLNEIPEILENEIIPSIT